MIIACIGLPDVEKNHCTVSKMNSREVFMFDDSILLITGGTGSFGNAVLRRFLGSNFSEIRIFSRDEKKQDDMRKKYSNPKLKFYIGDVRDYRSVLNAMRGVDFVYHAAALKQVPSCEFYPIPQNPKTPKPQNPKTPKPQNPKTPVEQEGKEIAFD